MEVQVHAQLNSDLSITNSEVTIPVYFFSPVIDICINSLIQAVPMTPVTIEIVDPNPFEIELPPIKDSGSVTLASTPGLEAENCGALIVT